MDQLQHEDDLVANFYNEQPQNESSDNESDAKRKRRRRKRDPYDYLPRSPIPEGPSDIKSERLYTGTTCSGKSQSQQPHSGAPKKQKIKSF